MNRILPLLILLALVSLVTAQVEEVNCWDYYRFDDLGYEIVNLESEKDHLYPGDMMFLSGEFKNNEDQTLPEVRILVQVWYFDNGIESLVDEFFVDIGMIGPKETKEFKGAYIIPKDAFGGEYLFETYALQKNYPLAGTPFIRGDHADRMKFTVISSKQDALLFDSSAIFYNRVQVSLHSPQSRKIFSPDEDVKFTVLLLNPGAKSRDAVLEKSLYYWDAFEDFKIRDLSREDFQITETQEINITLGKLDPGAYTLKLRASSGGSQAFLKLRFFVSGFKPKIWYSNVLDYPLEDKKNSVILCVGDMAPTMDPLSFRVDGTPENPLAEEDYNTTLPTPKKTAATISIISPDGKQTKDVELRIPYDDIQGFKIDLTPEGDYPDFKLDVNLDTPDYNRETLQYGEEFKVKRRPTVTPKPPEPEPEPKPPVVGEKPFDWTIVLIVLILILLIAVILFKKTR